MEIRVRKTVDLIISYINNASLRNYLKGNIDKIKTDNEIEFELIDKYDCYKTEEFNQLLDDYCKNNNITYEMEEVSYIGSSYNIARFKMKFN